MAPGEELTPEEKLLRVIQGNGPAPAPAPAPVPVKSAGPAAAAPTPAVAPAPSTPPRPAAERAAAPPPPPPAPAEAKTRLRVAAPQAEMPAAASRKAVPAADAELMLSDTPPQGQSEAAEAPPVEREKPLARAARRGDPLQRLVVVNRLLAACVVVVLALVAWQVYQGLAVPPAPEPAESGTLVVLPPEPVSLAPADQYMPASNLFWKAVVTRPSTNEPALPPESWFQGNVGLVGLSKLSDGRWKAILVDKSANKVHFLMAGEEMQTGAASGKRTLKLVSVEANRAVLSDGQEEFVLQRQ